MLTSFFVLGQEFNVKWEKLKLDDVAKVQRRCHLKGRRGRSTEVKTTV